MWNVGRTLDKLCTRIRTQLLVSKLDGVRILQALLSPRQKAKQSSEKPSKILTGKCYDVFVLNLPTLHHELSVHKRTTWISSQETRHGPAQNSRTVHLSLVDRVEVPLGSQLVTVGVNARRS